MSKNRIGFTTDFNLVNSNVGIATTNPTAKLQVAGGIKADFEISGVTTFTSYGGFIPQKQSVATASTVGFSTIGVGTFTQLNQLETGYTRLQGEFNTLSEDIIVEEGRVFEIATDRVIGITTIGTQNINVPSPSTVSPGTLESVTIGSHFVVPNSGISSRPRVPREGMVRFNDDLNTLEFWNGVEWRQFTVTGASGRGVFQGGDRGSGSRLTIIDYVNISTTGNALNFGSLTSGSGGSAGCSSGIRGLIAYGYLGPGFTGNNTIEYITIASEGNSIDFGDISVARGDIASCSSSSRGIFAGGYTNTPAATNSNVIDYVQISTLGNALDFGDLTRTQYNTSGCSSPTRGIFSGNMQSVPTTTFSSSINSITISSTGNAVQFGNLTETKAGCGSLSNSVRGIIGDGGNVIGVLVNSIEYITIASFGNAQYFGDLTFAKQYAYGTSNSIRGVFAGGASPTRVNNIDYITIASTGNAQDFGDLTTPRSQVGAVSDSHGGLGGF